MELHSYAKRRNNTKLSTEQKRRLVTVRIANDALFNNVSSISVEPWKQILTIAQLEDFNVYFVRKQWNMIISKYRKYKEDCTQVPTNTLDKELIKQLTNEWEFFDIIHEYMTRKTTNLHSYAMTGNAVENNKPPTATPVVVDEGQQAIDAVHNIINGVDVDINAISNEEMNISSDSNLEDFKEFCMVPVATNTDHDFYAKRIVGSLLSHMKNNETVDEINEEVGNNMENLETFMEIVSVSSDSSLASDELHVESGTDSGSDKKHSSLIGNLRHVAAGKISYIAAERYATTTAKSIIIPDTTTPNDTSNSVTATEKPEQNSTTSLDCEIIEPEEILIDLTDDGIITTSLTNGDCSDNKLLYFPDIMKNDNSSASSSTSTEHIPINNTNNTNGLKRKPPMSERDKYYRHKRRYNRRMESRFNDVLNVLGQIIETTYPDIDASGLRTDKVLSGTVSPSTSSEDSESEDDFVGIKLSPNNHKEK